MYDVNSVLKVTLERFWLTAVTMSTQIKLIHFSETWYSNSEFQIIITSHEIELFARLLSKIEQRSLVARLESEIRPTHKVMYCLSSVDREWDCIRMTNKHEPNQKPWIEIVKLMQTYCWCGHYLNVTDVQCSICSRKCFFWLLMDEIEIKVTVAIEIKNGLKKKGK